jgi:hypothetical protein
MPHRNRRAVSCRSWVLLEQTTQPLTTHGGSVPPLCCGLDGQLIIEALMVSFVVVMGLELADRPAQRLADQDYPFEARLFNRPHKALGDGIGVSGQLHRRRAVRRKSFELPIPSIPYVAGPSS